MAELVTTLGGLLEGAVDIGDLTALSYNKAKVITTAAERDTGGVVAGSWLIAAAVGKETRSAILLRVVETDEASVHHEFARHPDDIRLWRSYEAVVMGSFYVYEDAFTPLQVQFAAEVDAVSQPGDYRVYQPSQAGISWIASFSGSPVETPRLPLGVVRFSTARSVDYEFNRGGAEVLIDPTDFLARRTAVFGATRSGKSNGVKTLTSTIAKHAAITGEPIGQIIFDPQGEYAEANQQDGTALRYIGDADQVRVYRAVVESGPNADPRERRLFLNFYDTKSLPVVWGLVVDALNNETDDSIRAVRSVPMAEPDRIRSPLKWANWSRGRLAFYGLLQKAGFPGSFTETVGIPFALTKKGGNAYNIAQRQASRDDLVILPSPSDRDIWFASTPETCAAVIDWIETQADRHRRVERNRAENNGPGFGDDRVLGELEALLGVQSESWLNQSLNYWPIAQFALDLGGPGSATLIGMRSIHDDQSTDDITAAIWEDMVLGRLVIVDLSVGEPWATKLMSERITNHMLREASDRFRTGQEPVPIQVVVEEAHNLLEKGRMSTKDPWVRIAKEAAKYKIGLVYATQEVTSIDPRILANTHNWIVGHLNSALETNELSHYYEYGNFAGSIRRSEAVGYARIKTYSSPYLIPVQVRKFDHSMVNDVRLALGLTPIRQADQGVGLLS